MANYKFDYSIIDVVNAIGLPVRRWNSTTIDCDCPYCDVNPVNGHDGKGKLQLVIAKNFAHCCRCDTGIGMLDLYVKVMGGDTKTAHKAMLNYVNKPTYKQNLKKSRDVYFNARNLANKGSRRAAADVLDKTYRAFLAQCELYPKHIKELTGPKRGLTMAQIKGLGIKSVPTHKEQHQKIITNLIRQGIQFEGVPGFFIDKSGEWNFNLFRYFEGYLIPVLNLNRQVVGLQVRMDETKGDNNLRYIWFSSPHKEKGVSSGSPVHITSDKPSRFVYLTEGPLKADISALKSKKVFAAVAGVNNYKPLPAFFKKLRNNGTQVIVDCFDSDCIYNVKVEKARLRLENIVTNCGLKYIRMEWNPQQKKEYKGIDDYLLNVPKNQWKFSW